MLVTRLLYFNDVTRAHVVCLTDATLRMCCESVVPRVLSITCNYCSARVTAKSRKPHSRQTSEETVDVTNRPPAPIPTQSPPPKSPAAPTLTSPPTRANPPVPVPRSNSRPVPPVPDEEPPEHAAPPVPVATPDDGPVGGVKSRIAAFQSAGERPSVAAKPKWGVKLLPTGAGTAPPPLKSPAGTGTGSTVRSRDQKLPTPPQERRPVSECCDVRLTL